MLAYSFLMLADGNVLICCAQPESDIVIDF
jgi:hypothetical protein